MSDSYGNGAMLLAAARRRQGPGELVLDGAGNAPEPRKPESIDTGICLAAAMARRLLPDTRPS